MIGPQKQILERLQKIGEEQRGFLAHVQEQDQLLEALIDWDERFRIAPPNVLLDMMINSARDEDDMRLPQHRSGSEHRDGAVLGARASRDRTAAS